MSSKFKNATFREKHKIEDAYAWALDVQVADIPTEFLAVKNFTEQTPGRTAEAVDEKVPEIDRPF